ncbi:MAG TPA: SRPBCC family protein [Rubrivivax sp.]|nr:SRPBCC family protein [Rubrivivax sp.]
MTADRTARTVHLHRVLRCPPERLYRAFTEADAMARWLPPYGFICTVQQFDARVGGRFAMSFHNFGSGHSHSFGGEYLELLPHRRIRCTDRFDDPNLPGELQVTVALQPVSWGTELRIEQAGIPEVIPLEMCCLGWQESLAQLAKLVEPDIPG